MNTRSGQIYEIKDAQEQADIESRLGTKLTDLTTHEYEVLNALSNEERAEKLALMRFLAERKRLKAPHGVDIQNGFSLGYRAGVKDNV